MNRTILQAKRVLVTTMRGPDAAPEKVSSDDQRAVGVVEEGLRQWKRYEITRILEDADLIIVVRKAPGTVVWRDPRIGPPAPPVWNNPFPKTADRLTVFDAHGLGMEAPPLWSANERGGFNTPEIKLLRKFEKRVAEAEKQP